jgi:hypothetical protein
MVHLGDTEMAVLVRCPNIASRPPRPRMREQYGDGREGGAFLCARLVLYDHARAGGMREIHRPGIIDSQDRNLHDE